MAKKSFQLAAVFALVVLFFLSLLPVSADPGKQGATVDPTPTPTLEELRPLLPGLDRQPAAVRQADASSEAVELRTATSKHYRLGPNLYRADISAAPRHYQDAAGSWLDIDTGPVARAEGGFSVEANNVNIVFPETLNQSGFEVNATTYPFQAGPREVSAGAKRKKPTAAELAQNALATNQGQQIGSSIELPLRWQPLYLVYAGDSGPISSVLPAIESPATAVGDHVEYAQAFDNTTLTFQATVLGFSQQLHFTALPAEAPAEATRLEYAVQVNVPAGVQLYADGAAQSGDSFTTNRLELRDQAGNLLLFLAAPQLHDGTISRINPQGQFRIERSGDSLTLIAELPLAWLTDPGRQFPVTAEFNAIFALGLTTQLLPFFQDTWIYQCAPNGGVSSAVMWVGRFAGTGCSPGIERSLVQWTTSSLPQDAMIFDDPGGFGPTQSALWRLPSLDSGVGTQTIGTHRLLFAPWDFANATWLNRTATNAWTQPGAEQDYLLVPEDVVGLPAGGSPGFVGMGAVDSLVGSWHTWQYFEPWGNDNTGVIYRSRTETGSNQDRAFAQIGFSGPISAPMLSVTYFTDTVLSITPNVNFFLPRAPSPDYFSIGTDSSWRAIGIRAVDGGSDYDLFLSPTSNFDFSNVTTASLEIGSAPDFIVVRPDIVSPLFPWAAQWEGTGRYYQRYATSAGTLTPGGMINGSAMTFTVLSVYQVNLNTGFNYEITLDTTSGTQDLGLGLFAPAAAGGSPQMAKKSAVKQADSAGFGADEKLVFTPQTNGTYGLVVWNNGGTQNSNYKLSLKETPLQQVPRDLFLPVVLKSVQLDFPPPANLNFETGSFSPWYKQDVGGPLVANVVQNNASVPAGCFSGSFLARLGTPGQLAENTIPIGETYFEQRFNVPAGKSQLIFKYWAFSYDIIQGNTTGRSYDKFQVTVDGNPVVIAGNPAGSSDGKTLWQSGCKSFTVPVTAGKNVILRFSVFNETNFRFNSWAFVDDVSVQ